ncbi:alpha/beta hydrolase [Cellulomonas pakistanensis]|uniref:Alpha/beta hydrolase n=1 Tax=Cellulomonas pakistanensis TaxID=992287 RepID=A0A919U524_9CELL|nr:alpha/beta hydrolase [Cellulomonas pakistanensis]
MLRGVDAYTRDGLTFDVRDHVPEEPAPGGPVAVLLHGFPQDGSAYDDVAALLTARGVRALAPDQRGYSPGARPAGRRPYAVPELVADVLALLDAAGVARAHVVGHDWGGSVAWAFAHRHPGRTASLTALGTPHPAALRHGLRRGAQALRSSYVLGFQVPWLPERALLAGGGAGLRRSLTGSGLEPARADRSVARMREPGALGAALAWYRALPTGRGDGTGTVRVPTTYLSGRRDPFFAAASVAATRDHVDAPYAHEDLDADHWLPEHRAGDVATAVLAHVDAG